MKSVLIVGGGIAGITAAFNLSKAGFQVKIFEAVNNLGGRLTALFDSKSGDMIDNGQHALMTAYHTFLELIKECDTLNLLNIQKSLEVVYYDTNQNKSRLFAGFLPGKAGFILGFLMLGGLSINSKINIIKLIRKIENNQINDIENLTCLSFLKKYNQTDEAIIRFWEPFIIATMNCPIKIASAEILVKILKRAFIENLDNSKLILPKSDFKYLLEPLINKLKSQGVEIFTSKKIDKIYFSNESTLSVTTTNGENYQADYIISALQPFSLFKILPEELKPSFAYLEKFKYSPILSAYIWTDVEIFSEDFISALGTDIQWIFNRNKLIKEGLSKTYPFSYSITVSSAFELSKLKQGEVIEMITEDIKKLFPDFSQSNILHYRIITEKFATFIADPESEKIRPFAKTHINNFFLAGDWTNTKLPATIEGASLSGKIAAEMIIDNLNIS
ncbi:MAG: hydroxysqualene dehydroxylase HpnE [Candidatus Kapabacteria bacterium]|nr:hydroxysqualene dehydroxylase HpnE [Ignavibacteriota bacterium]MCW5884537.1 hydroxysqualene dehydroxylase HpnE [Candidatus Kapabacteria bacterium]